MADLFHVFLQDQATISLAEALAYELKSTAASPHPYIVCKHVLPDFGGKLLRLRPLLVPPSATGYASRNEGLAVQPSAIAMILDAPEERVATLPPAKSVGTA